MLQRKCQLIEAKKIAYKEAWGTLNSVGSDEAIRSDSFDSLFMSMLMSVSKQHRLIETDMSEMIFYISNLSDFFKIYRNAIDFYHSDSDHKITATQILGFQKCSELFDTFLSQTKLSPVSSTTKHHLGLHARIVLDKLCSFASELVSPDAVQLRKDSTMKQFDILEDTLYLFRCTLPMFTWLLAMLYVCLLPTQDIAPYAHIVDVLFMAHKDQIAENSTALSDIVGVDVMALGSPLNYDQATCSYSSKVVLVWYATLSALKCKVQGLPIEAERIQKCIITYLRQEQTKTDLKKIYIKLSELVFNSFSQKLKNFQEELQKLPADCNEFSQQLFD